MEDRICIICNKNKAAKGRKYCHTCSEKRRSPEAQERRRINTNIRVSKWSKNHRENINKWRRNNREQKKIEVINMYGGKCACCSESNLGFLTIDHINNDGGIKRKENTSEGNIIDHLFHKPIDKLNYQILCFNCNYGKNCNNGVCPHNEAKDSPNTLNSASS